ncbi:MAG: isoprenoid biosynthesis glyoxalase ElbB [Bdellovibrionales bacterium]|nr:isoprenoid biosynthesis glyoxalase ElbB [Bdellovibrionales bacterium]
MQRKIAVVLSGCGYLDGSEITEAVSSLIALDQCEAIYTCFSIDKSVVEVDHITAKDTANHRQCLTEAARIARGQVLPLSKLVEDNFDGVLFPGGFGAAKNLSNFAMKGGVGEADSEVKRVLTNFHQASKPIAAFCIAPATVALVLGKYEIEITIGNDKETIAEIEKTGAHHVECAVDDFVTDRENKIITSPAYMYDTTPAKVFSGIQKAVREFVEMA